MPIFHPWSLKIFSKNESYDFGQLISEININETTEKNIMSTTCIMMIYGSKIFSQSNQKQFTYNSVSLYRYQILRTVKLMNSDNLNLKIYINETMDTKYY